jgi:hypothetical protein
MVRFHEMWPTMFIFDYHSQLNLVWFVDINLHETHIRAVELVMHFYSSVASSAGLCVFTLLILMSLILNSVCFV